MIAHLLGVMRKVECVIVKDVKNNDRVVRVGDVWQYGDFKIEISSIDSIDFWPRYAVSVDKFFMNIDDDGIPKSSGWTLVSRKNSDHESRKPWVGEKWIFNSLSPEWTVSRVDDDKVTLRRAVERPSSSNMELIVSCRNDGSMPGEWSRVEQQKQRKKVREWWEVQTRGISCSKGPGPWVTVYSANRRPSVVKEFKRRKKISLVQNRLVHVTRYALVQA